MKVLSPHIGPYDMFAIEYGYRWYGKNTPEEEKDILFNFLSKHTDRLYKYSEAQDVRDAVNATGYTVTSFSKEPYEKKGLFSFLHK